MIRTPRPRFAVAGIAATAIIGAVLVPITANIATADTEPVASDLAAPTGLTPDSEGAVPAPVLKTVALHWNEVAGATGYRVQVGTDDTWSDDPVLSTDTVTNTLNLPLLLPHASYVWRVAALKGKALGHWTSESGLPQNEAQFTRGWRDAPVMVSPSSGQAVIGRPNFRWEPVDNASGYEVQVSTSADFPVRNRTTASPDTSPSPTTQTQTAIGTDTCFTARTQITPFTSQAEHGVDSVGPCNWTLLGTGQPLFWRVRALDRAVDAAVDGDTSPASQSGISYLPPSDTPNNAELSNDCPTTASASASPSPTASATATPTSSASATATPTATASATGTATPSGSATPTTAAAGGCAVAHESESGNWSLVAPFSASYPAASGVLDPQALVTTASLATDPDHLCTVDASDGTAESAKCSDVPTIRWNAVTGASRYRITVGLDDEFTNIQYAVESSALTWTAPDSWRDSSPALSYFYVVQACDDTHCGPVTSTPPSFRKSSPRTTLGATPPVKGPVLFSWSSYADELKAKSGAPACESLATPAACGETEDAYAYHLQVATSDDPSYNAPLIDKKVDGTSYASPTEKLSDGSFIWRVQALDSGTHALPWATSKTFVRDTTPPKVLSASPASKISTTTPVSVTFSEPVTGVDASSLGVSTPGVTGSAATVAVTSSTTAVLTPTHNWVPGATYTLAVSSAIVDAAGNAAVAGSAPGFTVNPAVDDSNAAVAYSGGWGRYSSSNASGSAYHAASQARRTASVDISGRSVTVLGCLSPKGGLVDITVVGKVTKRVSTYRSYSGCGVKLAVLTGLGSGTHTLRLTTTGTHVSASKGTSVGLDGVTVAP